MSGLAEFEPTELNKHEVLRFSRIFGGMPYAAGLRPGKDGFETVSDVAEFMEALSERLSAHAKHEDVREAKLLEAERLLRNGRELFAYFAGTNGTSPVTEQT